MSAESGNSFDMRGFIENSLLEWENRLSAVVIAGGCNLRCPYCHSWRYVTGLTDLEKLEPAVLFELLERQRGWIDGVVFTGGEPTLQPGLTELIRRTREYEVAIKLHTNGTRPHVLAGLLDEGLLDCLALDYKAPLDERLLTVSGSREEGMPDAVKESFRLAASSGLEREYHTTLAPAFITADTFKAMGEGLEPGGLWILQQFENGDCLDPVLAGSVRFTGAELDIFEKTASELHDRVLLKRGKSA